jgi:hypothetical protein
MVRSRAAIVAVTAAAAAVSLTGCGGSGPTAAQTPPPAAVTPTASSCPSPTTAAKTSWPAYLPADLPRPPHAHVQRQQTANGGVHVLQFTTPTSLRESVLFVVNSYPKAGYVLGRGDAEATEADAPFVHGSVRGLVRMISTSVCETTWLLATVDTQGTNNSPLLPPHTPSGTPSPLPFG